MSTITVKNIPDELYEKLKVLARANHRSVNREVIACIERAIRSNPMDVETVLAHARILRDKTADYSITDNEYNRIKNVGRQ